MVLLHLTLFPELLQPFLNLLLPPFLLVPTTIHIASSFLLFPGLHPQSFHLFDVHITLNCQLVVEVVDRQLHILAVCPERICFFLHSEVTDLQLVVGILGVIVSGDVVICSLFKSRKSLLNCLFLLLHALEFFFELGEFSLYCHISHASGGGRLYLLLESIDQHRHFLILVQDIFIFLSHGVLFIDSTVVLFPDISHIFLHPIKFLQVLHVLLLQLPQTSHLLHPAPVLLNLFVLLVALIPNFIHTLLQGSYLCLLVLDDLSLFLANPVNTCTTNQFQDSIVDLLDIFFVVCLPIAVLLAVHGTLSSLERQAEIVGQVGISELC